jgi:hypothetical protein
MLEMQEECRREMMTTYVQANNPTMFEEIYYNVSYPDEPIIPAGTHGFNNRQQPQRYQQQQQVVLNGMDNLNLNEKQQQQQQQLSVIDLVKTNLNPQANEFIPSKFLDTKQQ